MSGKKFTDRAQAQMKYVKEGYNPKDFEEYYDEYLKCPAFKINQNVEEVGGISEEAHFIMRTIAQEKLKEVFEIMKIDLTDDKRHRR